MTPFGDGMFLIGLGGAPFLSIWIIICGAGVVQRPTLVSEGKYTGLTWEKRRWKSHFQPWGLRCLYLGLPCPWRGNLSYPSSLHRQSWRTNQRRERRKVRWGVSYSSTLLTSSTSSKKKGMSLSTVTQWTGSVSIGASFFILLWLYSAQLYIL